MYSENNVSLANALSKKLPIIELKFANKVNGGLMVTTPHKGDVAIDFLEAGSTGFFFGSKTTYQKETKRVLGEIRQLEEEATKFLFDKWKETLKD